MDSRSNFTSYSSEFGDYRGAPPVLLLASSAEAEQRAHDPIEDAGFRVAPLLLDNVGERIARQASASALWIEVDGLDGPVAETLGAILATPPRFPVIVATTPDLIDPVAAIVGNAEVDILVDPSAADRLSAFALARVARNAPTRLNDISAEPGAARLRQLSDEVSRIAQTLARLSSGAPISGHVEKPPSPTETGGAPAVAGDTVRQVIRARRLRARFFDEDLFADPGWDMLLDLFQAEIAQHRVPVSSLCIAASVPPTTALRWIKTMTDSGLFLRRADPHDRRRIFVELSPAASDAMRRYFAEAGRAVAA